MRMNRLIHLLVVGALAIPAWTQQAPAAKPPSNATIKKAEKAADEYSIDDLPSDDELEQEERDAKNLMRLRMQQAQKDARSQDAIRKSNEEAAAAQAKIYKELLEARKNQEGLAQSANTAAMVNEFGQPSGQATFGPSFTGVQGGATRPRVGPGAELQRALDALALEDGPEVARQKGLAFIPMASIIDVRLVTAVNTAIPGPVVGQVVYDVWDVDMKYIVIPRGSKVIGTSASMASDTEARGRVVFTAFIDPSGRNVPMAVPLIGSNRIGVTGVDGKVNYHWGKVFGGSIAIGVLGAMLQTRSNNVAAPGAGFGNGSVSGQDLMIQNVTQGLGNVSNSILQRFVQIKPDIEIKEGSVVKLIITTNIMAKPYRHAWQGVSAR